MARREDDSKLSNVPPRARPSRRAFLTGTAAAAVVGTGLLKGGLAHAADAPAVPSFAATPPSGFVPFTAPGKIVKVTKSDCLQANQLYPKPDDAKKMLERALCEFSGKADAVTAMKQFIHPDDVVTVKLNGIAMQNMSTNKELVLPILDILIAAGVKPEKITVSEQWGSYLIGTRVNQANVPAGVKINIHNNTDSAMDERMIPGTGTKTKFVRALTDATAVINVSLLKDHSIAGYTGTLKNMAQGLQTHPAAFHGHHASPQLAMICAQDAVKSRVRLNITDGYKIMADGGPTWKQPRYVVPHESVYVSTDMVAMDTIGAQLVDKVRIDKGLQTLAAVGRPPAYIQTAAELGLGIGDLNQIQVREFTI
jgi:uncharacterized protein (DUF362 family)